jgi:hypothetical protein
LATPVSLDDGTGNQRFCGSVDPRLLVDDFLGVIRRYSNQELLLNTAGH